MTVSIRTPVRDMAGARVAVPCMDIATGADGQPVILPSGDRMCCRRIDGHFPRSAHADQDDDGQLREWA
jgi:hypothetical protein